MHVHSRVWEVGQDWLVEGVSRDEPIATSPQELKFTMNSTQLPHLRARPPFTDFQRRTLRYLGVAPSQLHPNSWGFLRAFELLLGELGRRCSRRPFFIIFEVSCHGEPGSEMRWYGHLSVKAQSGYKIFRPFTDSMKPWKHNYLGVAPVGANAIDLVVELNEKGEVKDTKFPFAWSKRHYNRRPATYSVKEESLDAEDKETLLLLRNMANYLDCRMIPVRPLVGARSLKGVKAALGRLWSNRTISFFLWIDLIYFTNLIIFSLLPI